MVFMEKDMMLFKLEFSGATYYFSQAEHLIRGVEQGGHGLLRNASYATRGGKFLKNRTAGEDLPNAILAMGRDKINELFDFMEGK